MSNKLRLSKLIVGDFRFVYLTPTKTNFRDKFADSSDLVTVCITPDIETDAEPVAPSTETPSFLEDFKNINSSHIENCNENFRGKIAEVIEEQNIAAILDDLDQADLESFQNSFANKPAEYVSQQIYLMKKEFIQKNKIKIEKEKETLSKQLDDETKKYDSQKEKVQQILKRKDDEISLYEQKIMDLDEQLGELPELDFKNINVGPKANKSNETTGSSFIMDFKGMCVDSPVDKSQTEISTEGPKSNDLDQADLESFQNSFANKPAEYVSQQIYLMKKEFIQKNKIKIEKEKETLSKQLDDETKKYDSQKEKVQQILKRKDDEISLYEQKIMDLDEQLGELPELDFKNINVGPKANKSNETTGSSFIMDFKGMCVDSPVDKSQTEISTEGPKSNDLDQADLESFQNSFANKPAEYVSQQIYLMKKEFIQKNKIKIEKEKETLSKQLDDETKKYDSQKEKVQQILKRKDDEISLYEQKIMDLDEQLGELPELDFKNINVGPKANKSNETTGSSFIMDFKGMCVDSPVDKSQTEISTEGPKSNDLDQADLESFQNSFANKPAEYVSQQIYLMKKEFIQKNKIKIEKEKETLSKQLDDETKKYDSQKEKVQQILKRKDDEISLYEQKIMDLDEQLGELPELDFKNINVGPKANKSNETTGSSFIMDFKGMCVDSPVDKSQTEISTEGPKSNDLDQADLESFQNSFANKPAEYVSQQIYLMKKEFIQKNKIKIEKEKETLSKQLDDETKKYDSQKEKVQQILKRKDDEISLYEQKIMDLDEQLGELPELDFKNINVGPKANKSNETTGSSFIMDFKGMCVDSPVDKSQTEISTEGPKSNDLDQADLESFQNSFANKPAEYVSQQIYLMKKEFIQKNKIKIEKEKETLSKQLDDETKKYDSQKEKVQQILKRKDDEISLYEQKIMDLDEQLGELPELDFKNINVGPKANKSNETTGSSFIMDFKGMCVDSPVDKSQTEISTEGPKSNDLDQADLESFQNSFANKPAEYVSQQIYLMKKEFIQKNKIKIEKEKETLSKQLDDETKKYDSQKEKVQQILKRKDDEISLYEQKIMDLDEQLGELPELDFKNINVGPKANKSNETTGSSFIMDFKGMCVDSPVDKSQTEISTEGPKSNDLDQADLESFQNSFANKPAEYVSQQIYLMKKEFIQKNKIKIEKEKETLSKQLDDETKKYDSQKEKVQQILKRKDDEISLYEQKIMDLDEQLGELPELDFKNINVGPKANKSNETTGSSFIMDFKGMCVDSPVDKSQTEISTEGPKSNDLDQADLESFQNSFANKPAEYVSQQIYLMKKEFIQKNKIKIEKEKETLSKQLDDETKKYDSQKEKVQQILKRKDDEISLYEQKIMDLDEQLGELPELDFKNINVGPKANKSNETTGSSFIMDFKGMCVDSPVDKSQTEISTEGPKSNDLDQADLESFQNSFANKPAEYVSQQIYLMKKEFIQKNKIKIEKEKETLSKQLDDETKKYDSQKEKVQQILKRKDDEISLYEQKIMDLDEQLGELPELDFKNINVGPKANKSNETTGSSFIMDFKGMCVDSPVDKSQTEISTEGPKSNDLDQADLESFQNSFANKPAEYVSQQIYLMKKEFIQKNKIKIEKEKETLSKQLDDETKKYDSQKEKVQQILKRKDDEISLYEQKIMDLDEQLGELPELDFKNINVGPKANKSNETTGSSFIMDFKGMCVDSPVDKSQTEISTEGPKSNDLDQADLESFQNSFANKPAEYVSQQIYLMKKEFIQKNKIKIEKEKETLSKQLDDETKKYDSQKEKVQQILKRKDDEISLYEQKIMDLDEQLGELPELDFKNINVGPKANKSNETTGSSFIMDFKGMCVDSPVDKSQTEISTEGPKSNDLDQADLESFQNSFANKPAEYVSQQIYLMKKEFIQKNKIKIEKEKETLSKQLDDETKKYDSQKEKVQQILKRKDDEISLYEQKIMDLDEQLGELPELDFKNINVGPKANKSNETTGSSFIMDFKGMCVDSPVDKSQTEISTEGPKSNDLDQADLESFQNSFANKPAEYVSQQIYLMKKEFIQQNKIKIEKEKETLSKQLDDETKKYDSQKEKVQQILKRKDDEISLYEQKIMDLDEQLGELPELDFKNINVGPKANKSNETTGSSFIMDFKGMCVDSPVDKSQTEISTEGPKSNDLDQADLESFQNSFANKPAEYVSQQIYLMKKEFIQKNKIKIEKEKETLSKQLDDETKKYDSQKEKVQQILKRKDDEISLYEQKIMDLDEQLGQLPELDLPSKRREQQYNDSYF
ncbi:putative leucine-rich repeat-containing protein DDB_G0290503 [Clytia hemisphaerica]|uniref:putative leucine-rich repeat-containing protein DDB_G0290503 n=1 Tax=Clytia hemisphaerica TaxID=252671 RepID=UPI0034D5157E